MADINFILDSSTSVTSVNYEKMKRLTVQISQAFNVGKRLTHYAMLHYGYWVDIDFTFAESNYWVKANLEEKILASEYLYGNINLKTLRLTLSLPLLMGVLQPLEEIGFSRNLDQCHAPVRHHLRFAWSLEDKRLLISQNSMYF